MDEAVVHPVDEVVVGRGLLARIWSRRVARYRAAGAAELGLRDRSGAHSPLLRRWRHGYGALTPGRIVFEPYGPLGLRVFRPRTEPIVIEVTGVARDVRRITGVEAWWASGVVQEIHTPLGVVEMVCGYAQDPASVVERILPPRDGGPSSR